MPRKTPDILTFGCRLNAYESQVISDHIAAAGLEDVIVVNSCAVTAEAVRQVRQSIRKARRERPGARLIVTGCAAQTDPESFAVMDEVDLVLGNQEKLLASEWRRLAAQSTSPPDFGVSGTEKTRVNDIMSVRETAGHLLDGFKGSSRAYVQVQNGCDHRCTFCIIPFGRGNSRSTPVDNVIRQIEHLTRAGYQEIVLTGVDLTSYGADLPGAPGLGQLVQKILAHPLAPERLRISSIDSIEADAALIEAIAGDTRVMPHLHLSLQAGDNMILKRMKRRHLREDAIRFCQQMHEKRPEIAFGADIIVGFPTETEAMFENSLKLVEECGLTYLHVFPFSPRKGTPAARMPQLERGVIKARAARLRALGEARVATYYASLVGTKQRLLMEGERRGRSEGYAPVRLKAAQPVGSVVGVEVTGFREGELLANVLYPCPGGGQGTKTDDIVQLSGAARSS